jgi:hypothetical protein
MYPSILKTSSADDSASCSPPIKNKNKNVRFDGLIINEFPIELGDNVPKTGAPVSMSRTACRSLVIALEHFESIRPPRRPRNSLNLTAEARTERLLLAGYSFEEIVDAVLIAHRIQVSRDEVIQEHASKQGLSKFVQSTRRILKNMILPRGRPIGKRVRAAASSA